MNLKNMIATGLLVGSTIFASAQTDTTNYTICIPNSNNKVATEKPIKDLKTDTVTYTQDGDKYFINTKIQGTISVPIKKENINAKDMESLGLDKAYTGDLENTVLAKDSAIADIQAELDSTKNYFMRSSIAATVGANFEDLGDNSFKVNPVVGLGIDFHLYQISPTSKLSLGVMGYIGTPTSETVTEGAPVVVKTETNPAGPYVYNTDFVDQTSTVESIKHVADLTLKGSFNIGDYSFVVGAGPSFSTKAVSTTVDSEKQTSITALSTGNVIPSNTYDLGSETTNEKTSVVVQGANAELNYFGKNGKFGVGVYGSNLGSENPHFGLKATFKLFK